MKHGMPENHIELHELRIKALDNVLSAIADAYSLASFPYVYSQLQHAAENIRVAKGVENNEFKILLLTDPVALTDLPLFEKLNYKSILGESAEQIKAGDVCHKGKDGKMVKT